MKTLRILTLTIILVLSFTAIVASAQTDSPLPNNTPLPTDIPAIIPTSVPDLPPGTDTDNFDIVEWLTYVAGPASGALVAWFFEKTRLSKYVEMLQPQARRNVALIVSGAFGAAAYGLLSLIVELPAGSVEVINALLAMVSSQVTHGYMALGNSTG